MVVPENVTIVKLPAKCPELNPVENVWQFMRNNWLSNRVFASYDAIVDYCCDAWTVWPLSPGASCPSAYAGGQPVRRRESWYQ